MKRIFLSVGLLIGLLLCLVGQAAAITVSATPSAPTVGGNVLVGINSILSPVVNCSINVNFGDGNAGSLGCAANTVCVGSLNHVYSSAGLFTITASDTSCLANGVLPSGTANVTATCPALTITTATLPNGVVDQSYDTQLLAKGGIGPINWGLVNTSSPLPAGLTLSATGLLSGTPTRYGSATVIIGVGDSCTSISPVNPANRTFPITIASPSTTELTITRLQLSFDNGRAEITVKRNQPGLRANADLSFNGSGPLLGYWEVDGRILSQINQHLTYGKSIRLTSPAIPFLPTFVEGSHRVKLVITAPANNIPFPEAIYYVTAEESSAELAPIQIAEPRNHTELPFASPSFSWQENAKASVYLIEYYADPQKEPIASAYTKGTGYVLPETILTKQFAPGKAYWWRVKSYDGEGNLLGASELSRILFK